jgi:predicted pyridoxine 5'-phosphate oxidase superfamily flavin-nucleotide-binding protein
MSGPFHAGELELQRRAGVLDEARAVGRIISDRLPAGAGRFLSRQRLAVTSSLDADGRVWASLLTGPPGFLSAPEDRLLRLATEPFAGDPLRTNLAARPELGLLVLDPRTRQRLRFNGRGQAFPEGIFLVVEQAYGNCPKYIQLREAAPDDAGPAGEPTVAAALDRRAQAWIAGADTAFIASFHPQGGPDASHRGGFPGFIRVLAPDLLAFEDYPGNGMFNTLGNLLAYPRAGLLFVDFETGDVLQLSGGAQVGQDSTVRFAIESVRELPAASPLRFRLTEYSPANPPLSHPAPAGIPDREPARAGRGRRG